MALRIFITATNTDIGKTHTTLKLLEAFTRMGLRVGAFKPVETGVTNLPQDGTALHNALKRFNPAFQEIGLETIVPVRFQLPAAPYVAKGTNPIDYQTIDRAFEKIEAVADVVIIEGAGGILVPLDDETTMLDLARRFNAAILLVGHCRLGCINDLMLNIRLFEQAGLEYRWVLNCRDDDQTFAAVSLPYLRDRFGTVPVLQRDLFSVARSFLPQEAP